MAKVIRRDKEKQGKTFTIYYYFHHYYYDNTCTETDELLTSFSVLTENLWE